jgi:ankyrin repeat protein
LTLAGGICTAAGNGHASVTKKLIEACCSIDLQEKNGFTLLFIAAQQGHACVTKQLIEAHRNIDLHEVLS